MENWGEQLRQLRLEKKIGLRELARLAEMSPAFLTAIEQGKSSPTLAMMHKILSALGTSLAEFFSGPVEDFDYVFPEESQKIAQDALRRYKILLPISPKIKFQMFHEFISAEDKESDWEMVKSEVACYLIKGGPARLEIDGAESITIKKGDVFYIPAGVKHRMVNISGKPIELVSVISPPVY